MFFQNRLFQKTTTSYGEFNFPELKINLSNQIDSISIEHILNHLKPYSDKFTSIHIDKIKNLSDNPTYTSKSIISSHSMISTFYYLFTENTDETAFYESKFSEFLYNCIQNSLNNKNFHKTKTLESLLKNVGMDQFEFLDINIKTLSYDIPDLSLILERHLSNEEVKQVINLLISHYKANFIELVEGSLVEGSGLTI